MPNAVSVVEISSSASGFRKAGGSTSASAVVEVSASSVGGPSRRLSEMLDSIDVKTSISGDAIHSWWLAKYIYRRNVSIQAPLGESVSAGHPVIVEIPKTVLTPGRKVREDFEDVEVIYVVNAELYHLYREVRLKEDGAIEIAFELQGDLEKGAFVEDQYFIYHGNLDLVDQPLRPLRNGQLPTTVPVGWKLAGFDDSTWTFPTIASPPEVSTSDWPVTAAIKYDAPDDQVFYRRWMSADYTGPGRMYLVAEVNTEVQVYLDDTLVLEKKAGTTGVFSVSVPYAGNQQLAILVSNKGSWAWQWLRNADGSGPPIRRTYDPAVDSPVDPWKADESGVTPAPTDELATPLSATPEIEVGLLPTEDETSVFNLDPWPAVIMAVAEPSLAEPESADRINYTRPGEHWRHGVSNVDNARATVLLYAHHFRIMSEVGRDKAIMEVQVDGSEWEDVDLYSDIEEIRPVYEKYDLSADLHEVRVRVSGRSRESSIGDEVNIHSFEYFKSAQALDTGEEVIALFWKTSLGGE